MRENVGYVMSKINIKVSLACDESIIYNKHEFIGIKTENIIKYKENDVLVTVKFHDKELEIIRENDKYNLKLNFIENKETDSIYNLKGYGNLIIKTFTKKLICDNHIVVEYYLNKQNEIYRFELFYEVIK